MYIMIFSLTRMAFLPWEEWTLIFSASDIIFFAAQREGYCHHGLGGRPGGRLRDLQSPYLCNHVMDFHLSKFCGIV